MSKTIDNKIKEFKQHFLEKSEVVNLIDGSARSMISHEDVKAWLQQALSEVERESYERGYLAGQDKLVKNLKIHLMPYELKGRT